MKVSSIISIVKHSRETELAGAADGAAWLREVRGVLDDAKPGFHVLDFKDVRLATVSWLREAVLGAQKYLSAMRPEIVLIVANFSTLVQEEFIVALEATGSVFISAEFTNDLEVHNPILLGRLDPALNETLAVVQGKSAFDAPFVSLKLQGVGLSAANNRLAALQDKGILTSERRGRKRIYRVMLENLRHGQ